MNNPENESPLLSVVLPTCNRARLLGHAIRSVLAQTHSKLELIVVDDCFPDDTRAVVESFDDRRIVYARNPTNLKLPRWLNAGFERARGQYLTWTSDDNLYDPDALRQMVEAIRGEACDFVFADYYELPDLETETGKPLDFRRRKLPDAMGVEKGNRIGACSVTSRTDWSARWFIFSGGLARSRSPEKPRGRSRTCSGAWRAFSTRDSDGYPQDDACAMRWEGRSTRARRRYSATTSPAGWGFDCGYRKPNPAMINCFTLPSR